MISKKSVNVKHLHESGWCTLKELVQQVNQRLEDDNITENVVRHYAGRNIIDPGINAAPLQAVGVKGKRHVNYYPPETIDIIVKIRQLLNEGYNLDQILSKKKENEEIMEEWNRTEEKKESPEIVDYLNNDLGKEFIRELISMYHIYRREEKFQNKKLVTYRKFLEIESEYQEPYYYGDYATVAEIASQGDLPAWATFHLIKLMNGKIVPYSTFTSTILSDQIPASERPPYDSGAFEQKG